MPRLFWGFKELMAAKCGYDMRSQGQEVGLLSHNKAVRWIVLLMPGLDLRLGRQSG